jgi:hypothetical protein
VVGDWLGAKATGGNAPNFKGETTVATPTDEDLRVRSYLLSQSNKLSIPELVEKVRRDTRPLREAAAAVPPARFFERPVPQDWSAAEVFTHILEMNERGASAIEGILDRGALPPPINDVMSGATRTELRDAEAYWQAYDTRREQLLARALRASGVEHLDINITHNQFGDLSWREWLLFLRVHDLDHMRQLQSVAQHFAG